jgi:hypothetical protein
MTDTVDIVLADFQNEADAVKISESISVHPSLSKEHQSIDGGIIRLGKFAGTGQESAWKAVANEQAVQKVEEEYGNETVSHDVLAEMFRLSEQYGTPSRTVVQIGFVKSREVLAPYIAVYCPGRDVISPAKVQQAALLAASQEVPALSLTRSESEKLLQPNRGDATQSVKVGKSINSVQIDMSSESKTVDSVTSSIPVTVNAESSEVQISKISENFKVPSKRRKTAADWFKGCDDEDVSECKSGSNSEIRTELGENSESTRILNTPENLEIENKIRNLFVKVRLIRARMFQQQCRQVGVNCNCDIVRNLCGVMRWPQNNGHSYYYLLSEYGKMDANYIVSEIRDEIISQWTGILRRRNCIGTTSDLWTNDIEERYAGAISQNLLLKRDEEEYIEGDLKLDNLKEHGIHYTGKENGRHMYQLKESES